VKTLWGKSVGANIVGPGTDPSKKRGVNDGKKGCAEKEGHNPWEEGKKGNGGQPGIKKK